MIENVTLTSESTNIFDSEKPGFIDYLIYWLQDNLPSQCVPPHQQLMTQMEKYLWKLTDKIAPPPRELADQMIEYIASQVRLTEDYLPFEEISTILRSELFNRLEPSDFTPMNRDGVNQALVLFSSGGLAEFLKTLLEFLKQFKDGLKKLEDLQIPANFDITSKEFRRMGPFQILALGEIRMVKSSKASDILHPDSGGKPTTLCLVHTEKTFSAPPDTVAVSAELYGFSFLYSNGPINLQPSGLSTLPFNAIGSDDVGPISCHVTVNYNMLKSKDVTLSANHYGFFLPTKVGHNEYITVITSVQLKYYKFSK